MEQEMPEWRYAAEGLLPNDGVTGGFDVDGEPLLIGRAHHGAELIPGKIVQSHGCCYVSYMGEERRHAEYEYLVQPIRGLYRWIPSSDGQVPPGAVIGGQTSNGEFLFVGRGYYQSYWIPGKVHPSHGVLYIPFAGREIRCPLYEVLVPARI